MDSAWIRSSGQSGCCALTPARTNEDADRHMASTVASFAAGDKDLRITTSVVPHRS
ncbi:MAG: hypothetical protein RLZZ217_1149 [Planctomycetota bacterium]